MWHDGRTVGVGLIPDIDFGVWNLALLNRRSFRIPQNVEEHSSLLVEYFDAKRIAYFEIAGHRLGSYAMLMEPFEFQLWLACPESKALGDRRKALRTLLDGLLRAPVD